MAINWCDGTKMPYCDSIVRCTIWFHGISQWEMLHFIYRFSDGIKIHQSQIVHFSLTSQASATAGSIEAGQIKSIWSIDQSIKWQRELKLIYWSLTIISTPLSTLSLTLKVMNFWKFTSYCSLKPLWSGMREVVPARTSPTLHLPSPPTVHQLSHSALRVDWFGNQKYPFSYMYEVR